MQHGRHAHIKNCGVLKKIKDCESGKTRRRVSQNEDDEQYVKDENFVMLTVVVLYDLPWTDKTIEKMYKYLEHIEVLRPHQRHARSRKGLTTCHGLALLDSFYNNGRDDDKLESAELVATLEATLEECFQKHKIQRRGESVEQCAKNLGVSCRWLTVSGPKLVQFVEFFKNAPKHLQGLCGRVFACVEKWGWRLRPEVQTQASGCDKMSQVLLNEKDNRK